MNCCVYHFLFSSRSTTRRRFPIRPKNGNLCHSAYHRVVRQQKIPLIRLCPLLKKSPKIFLPDGHRPVYPMPVLSPSYEILPVIVPAIQKTIYPHSHAPHQASGKVMGGRESACVSCRHEAEIPAPCLTGQEDFAPCPPRLSPASRLRLVAYTEKAP